MSKGSYEWVIGHRKGLMMFAYEWHRAPDWNTKGFTNSVLTCWLILEGERIVQIAGNSYLVGPNDLLIVPEDQPITTQLCTSVGSSFHYLAIAISQQVQHIDWRELYGVPVRSRLQHGDGLEQLIERWKELITHWQSSIYGRLSEERGMASTYDQLEVIELEGRFKLWLSSFLRAMTSHLTQPEPVLDKRVRKVCAYIQECYAEPIHVNDMAALVHISEGHLRELFQQTVHMSPYRYLLAVRLARAKQLLMENRLTLSEIAHTVGFEDYRHFQSLFRRKTGVAPSQYRKLIVNGHEG